MPVKLIADCTLVDGELDRQFERPAPELSEEARLHLGECRRCRDLYHWASEGPETTGISPELTKRIQGALVASLRPVKPLPSDTVSAFRFFGIFVAAVLVLAGITGLRGLDKMSWAEALGIAAILAAGAALFSISLAWQVIPGSLERISSKVVSVISVLGFLAGVALLFPWHGSEPFIAAGWHCLLRGLAVAATGAILLWLLVRRGAPLSATRMGATLGALAGLLGVTVLQFQCIHQYASHLLVWHGGVLFASAGVGALVGGAVARSARRRP
jgi:hypothetical protein